MAKLKTGTTVGGVAVVVTTDSRLSDARTPTAHTHAISDVTNLQTTLDGKAPLASPALTGTPTAPTASAGTSTTQIATTAFVQTAVSNLVDTAPTTLDTLNELAAALGDDPNFASTVATSIGTKVTANSPITGATATKITYDSKGLVTGGTSLSASDIPNLDAGKITTGTLSVSRGGTGATTFTSGEVLVGNGTSAVSTLSRSGIDSRTTFPPSSHDLNSHSDVTISTPASNQVLVYNGTAWVNGSIDKGELQNVYVYAKASAAITKGQAVQFAGAEGDHILIKPAVPSEINANPNYIIGISESTLALNDFGYVIVNGRLNLDTSVWTAGDILYFASAGSTPGALTTTRPTDPNATIEMAAVSIDGVGNGEFVIRTTIFSRDIDEIFGLQTALDSKAPSTNSQTVTLTGAVTGTGTITNYGNVSITTTATSDPTLTINGDASGSATFTNLGNATLTLTISDDSHNHTIANVDGLQTALDGKLGTTAKAADSELLDGIDSSQFLRSDANDSASGIISLTNTTDSTSTTTGALVVSGGVGIAKNLYVGGDVDLAGKLTVAENATFNGSIDIAENLSIGGFLNVAGDATFGGSIDIGENLSVGGYLNVAGDATFGGSIDIAEDVNVGGSLRVQESIEAGTVDSSASAIRDNRLFLRYGATTAMGDGEFAGVVAINADGLNDAALLFDGNNKAKVGDINAWLPFETATTSLSNMSTDYPQALHVYGSSSSFDGSNVLVYSYNPTNDIPTGTTAYYYNFNNGAWYEYAYMLTGPDRSVWTPITGYGTVSEATLLSDISFRHYVCAAFFERYEGTGTNVDYVLKSKPTLTSPYRIFGGNLYEYDSSDLDWYESVPSLGTTEPAFVSLAGTLNLTPTTGSKIISASTNSSLTIRNGYYIKIPYDGVYGAYGGTWPIYDWNGGTKTFKFQVYKNAESSTAINSSGTGVEILKYAFNDTATSATTVRIFELDNTSDIVVRPDSSEMTDRGLVYWNDSSNVKQIETTDKSYIDNSGNLTFNYGSPIRFLGSDPTDRLGLIAAPTGLRTITLPDATGTLALTSNIPTNNDQLTNGAGYITSSALTGLATETYVNTAVSNLVASAPSTLDTLNELAAALGDDPNFATTVTNSIAGKLSLTGGTMTGTLGVSTIDMGTTGVINFNKTAGTVSKIVGANNGIDFYSDDPINFYESDASTIAVSISTNNGSVTATTFLGSLSGNATTATTLQTARTINGTSFDGSASITTANWGTARTLTIGSTGKSVNGSGNVSWSLAEIGAYAATNPSGYISDYTVTKADVDTALGTAAADDTYFYRGDGTWAAVSTSSGDITEVIAGNGLSGGGTSGSVTLNLDFSELTDITLPVDGTSEMIIQVGTTEGRKALSEINLSAFNNDAGWTSNAGDITSVTAGVGLSGGGTSGGVTLNLDFSELTDMTGDISGTTEFILQNGTTESRKAASEIKLSVFNNDAGWTSNTGTVSSLADLGITSTAAELNTLDGFTGSYLDLNYANSLRLTGVTSTEFDKLDGVSGAIWHANNLSFSLVGSTLTITTS